MANQTQLTGSFRREEALASVAISPGMLGEMDSDGKIKPHTTEGGYAERLVAVEDALQGANPTAEYAIGALVSFNVVAPGAEVNMLIAAGEDIAIGDELISDGAGLLIENGSEASSTTVKQIIGYATEANDLSTSSGAADRRSKVRIV